MAGVDAAPLQKVLTQFGPELAPGWHVVDSTHVKVHADGSLQPSRLLNGYRIYEEDTIKALRFLRQAQTLGITLSEIKQLLELTRNGQRPCQALREVACRHLNDIDARIRQLRSLRNELRDLLSRNVVADSDELCPLISSNHL